MKQSAGITKNIQEIRRLLKELEVMLPAAEGWQWTAPPRPRPDAEDDVRSAPRDSYSDPTASVAIDADRLTLREAVKMADWETSLTALSLDETVSKMRDALEPYGGA